MHAFVGYASEEKPIHMCGRSINTWFDFGWEKKECVFVSVSSVTEEKAMEKVECAEKESTEKEDSLTLVGWEERIELSIVKKVAQCEWHMWKCVYVLDWYMITAFLLLGMLRENGERSLPAFALVREGNRREKKIQ